MGGSSSARVQDNGEGRSPSCCVVVMEGVMVVMGLLRASLNGSWPQATDFDKKIGRKFRSPVTKVYGGGEWPWSTAMGRPPWFLQTMVTFGGEFGYKFLCRTIPEYINILVKSSCVN